jgi:hypothetical protein
MGLTDKPERDHNHPPSLVPLVRPGGPPKIGWRATKIGVWESYVWPIYEEKDRRS